MLTTALALLLGAAAAGLRMWQRTAGYDASGLPVPFALPAVVLTLFLLLCAGDLFCMARRQLKTMEEQSRALPRGPVSAAALALSGALLLAGGAMSLLRFFRDYLAYSQVLYATQDEQQEALRRFLSSGLLALVLALAAVAAAAALLLRAKRIKQGGEMSGGIAVSLPPLFCCVWLIEIYRQHTANPILWDYVLLLLASVALLISTYERAGFALGVGRPRRTVFTSLAALLLTAAALPDCGGAVNAVILCALGVQTAVETTALLDALAYRPKRLSPEPSQDTTNQEDVSHEE